MSDNKRRKGDPFAELRQLHDRSLPHNWVPLSRFIKVSDKSLFQKTCGKFPGGSSENSFSETNHHPVLLLKRIGNYNYRFCPCTSQKRNRFSYIPEGTELELNPMLTDKNSYICHVFLFGLSADNSIVTQDNFSGIVRENDIVGDQYKEGMK